MMEAVIVDNDNGVEWEVMCVQLAKVTMQNSKFPRIE